MTTTPAPDHPDFSLVTVDLPALEGYAGRVDRLAAEVSLTQASVVGPDDSGHDELVAYVDGLLVALCTRWAAVVVDGLDVLLGVWTDPASRKCATYAHAVGALIETAGRELASLREGHSDGDQCAAA